LAAVPSIGRASLVERPHVAPHAEATHGLYERHAAKIQAYCHHQLGSREEAEDAVQTTFMNAFRALGRGVVPEAETAWLFKIAENVCLSRRRSSWRRGRIESPSDFDVIEEVVPGPSRQRDELIGIEDALASMPEQQRRAILLREWQGLSYREIAEELEISQSAVETLIFRARRSLAQGLEQPDLFKRPKRKGLRRALRALDFGTVAAAAKTLLTGGAAVKATAAAAVAVTAAAGTGATVVVKHHEGHSPKSTPAPVVQKVVPAPAEAPAAVRFAPTAAAQSVPVVPAHKAVPAPAPAKPKLSSKPEVAPVAAAPAPTAAAPAPVAATHEAAPAPAAAAPQPEPAAPAPAEPKNDEGHSDRTERRPEAVAPVATTTVTPAPQTVQAPTETIQPVTATLPKQMLDVISPTYEPTPVTTSGGRGTTTTVPLEPTPVTTVQPVTTTAPTPVVTTTTTTPIYTTSPTYSGRGSSSR
jgi:RNA polymerase sigma factor (sigma-70 family)